MLFDEEIKSTKTTRSTTNNNNNTAAAVATAITSTTSSISSSSSRPIMSEIEEPVEIKHSYTCLLYTSPSPRDRTRSRMPSSA